MQKENKKVLVSARLKPSTKIKLMAVIQDRNYKVSVAQCLERLIQVVESGNHKLIDSMINQMKKAI